MSDLIHGKRIQIESVYDGVVTATKHEVEQSLFSTKQYILKDVIDALRVINNGETKKLSIEICIDSKARYRLKTRWVV